MSTKYPNQKRYRHKHPEKTKKQRKEWRDRRRSDSKTKKKDNQYASDSRRRLREEVIAVYGGECVCCGTRYFPHLEIDHVNGDGAQERKTVNSRALPLKIKREGFPDMYQILCASCNKTKHRLGRCECSG